MHPINGENQFFKLKETVNKETAGESFEAQYYSREKLDFLTFSFYLFNKPCFYFVNRDVWGPAS